MVTVLLFNIVALFFAVLESAKIYSHGLKWSMFTIFVFLALRYDYGNDYMGYLASFMEINQYLSFDLSLFVQPKYEIGWVFLNRIFAPAGFFIMMGVISAFTCFILYRFIKNYVPKEYYWFAVFIYVFQPYNMLVLSSAVRQSISISLFLLSVDFIYRKKRILVGLLLILLATQFHTSAYILIPFILISAIPWKIRPVSIIILILLLISIPLFFDSLLQYQINYFIKNYLSMYETYSYSEGVTEVGVGFFISVVFLYFILLIGQKQTGENLFFFKMAALSFLILVLSLYIIMIIRLNLYLAPFFFVAYPLVFKNVRPQAIKFFLLGLIVSFTVYQFYFFFQSDIWSIPFGEYKTIFSAPSFF